MSGKSLEALWPARKLVKLIGVESIILTILAIVVASVAGGLFVRRGEKPDQDTPRTLRLDLVAPKDGKED